jgi:hypothetical protein
VLFHELPGFGSLCEIALGGCPQARQSVPALDQHRQTARSPAAQTQLSKFDS